MLKQKNIGYIITSVAIILLIILIFVKADKDKTDVFLCEVVAANPNLEMEDCPAHQSKTSWFIIVEFGLSFLLLGTGIYLIYITNIKSDLKKIDTSKLDEKEKVIYELLKNSNGSMYQSDIVKETGFSKVKTTRILDRLSSKDVIDRKRRGMTNIVVLK